MDALHQRLKELDSDTFHKLCFQLLKERHPGSDLRQVEGASGDEGLDIFEGELSGSLTIWQCKAFPNGIGESQKSQIRKSLNTALRQFKPKHWILCLSVNLDAKTSRSWEKYKRSKSNVVQIGEMFASQIVQELIHRRTLRNYFFPNVAIDPIELKRLLTKSGELTTAQLEAITESNLEEYIERLKEQDARFNYELVFSGDLGPQVTRARPRPGLMMTMQNGGKTLNVFARDVEALRQNPPVIKLSFSGTGLDKFRTMVKTGIIQTFQDTEFEHLGSNVPLFELPAMKGQTLIVSPTQSFLDRRMRTRFTFSKGDQAIEYSFIELAPVRSGTEEMELRTVSETLPFELRLTVNPEQHSGRLEYLPKFFNSEIRQVAKFTDAIKLLHSGATVTVWNLEKEHQLFTFEMNEGRLTDAQKASYEFIADLKQIADRFNLNLKLPDDVSDSDFEAISFLKSLMQGIEYTSNSVSFTLTKSETNIETIENLPRVITCRSVHDTYEPKPTLFGHQVDTGPVMFTVNQAEISDYEATLSTFKTAQIGDAVPFNLIPRGAARLELQNRKE
jgi:hypothetical protein